VIHGDDGLGGAPQLPDGPPPAREQLPLPRRQHQAHLAPHLRAPDGSGISTPFAAFTADDTEENARPERSETTAGKDASVERAAAFHAGASRARGSARTRPRRSGDAGH
jgi:hypothetical protein